MRIPATGSAQDLLPSHHATAAGSAGALFDHRPTGSAASSHRTYWCQLCRPRNGNHLLRTIKRRANLPVRRWAHLLHGDLLVVLQSPSAGSTADRLQLRNTSADLPLPCCRKAERSGSVASRDNTCSASTARCGSRSMLRSTPTSLRGSDYPETPHTPGSRPHTISHMPPAARFVACRPPGPPIHSAHSPEPTAPTGQPRRRAAGSARQLSGSVHELDRARSPAASANASALLGATSAHWGRSFDALEIANAADR